MWGSSGPHETQPDQERRAKLVKQVLNQRRPVSDAQPKLATFDDDYQKTADAFLSAFARASRWPGESCEQLLDAMQLIDELEAVWAQPLPRPYRNRGRLIGRGLTEIRSSFELFIEALGAPSMSDAEKLGLRGNTLLKKGEDIIDEAREINRLAALIGESTSFDFLTRWGSNTQPSEGEDQNICSIDRRLSAIYRPEQESGGGLGLQWHLMRPFLLTSLDDERCEDIANEAESRLRAHPLTMQIFNSKPWQTEQGRVTALLSGAIESAQSFSQNDGTDLETLGAWMDMVPRCRDGVIRHALSTMLANDQQDYIKKSRDKAGLIIKKASETFPQLSLNESLAPELRNASAHSGYDIDEQGQILLFGEDNSQVLTWEELIDKLLAYLEVAVGLLLGIMTALTQLGVDVDLTRRASWRDRKVIMGYLLGALGLENISLNMEEGTLRIEASGPDIDWLRTTAMLSPLFDDQIGKIEAFVRTNDLETTFSAETADFRNFTATTENQHCGSVLEMAKAVAGSSLNGRSPWDNKTWAKVVALIMEEHPEDTLTSRVRRIQTIRSLVTKAGITEVSRYFQEILEAIRSGQPDASVGSAYPSFARQPPTKQDQRAWPLFEFGCSPSAS